MSENAVAVQPDSPVQVKVELRIEQYVKCRDAINDLKEKHTKELEPLVDLQNKLTGWLQRFMTTNGANSIKSKYGTAYTSTKYTASLADPEAFMKYVISTNSFDLLDRKANVTACKDHVTEKGALPPGVNMSAIETIGVRRASGTR